MVFSSKALLLIVLFVSKKEYKKINIFVNSPKNVAFKLDGGGGNVLVAEKRTFFSASLSNTGEYFESNIHSPGLPRETHGT